MDEIFQLRDGATGIVTETMDRPKTNCTERMSGLRASVFSPEAIRFHYCEIDQTTSGDLRGSLTRVGQSRVRKSVK